MEWLKSPPLLQCAQEMPRRSGRGGKADGSRIAEDPTPTRGDTRAWDGTARRVHTPLGDGGSGGAAGVVQGNAASAAETPSPVDTPLVAERIASVKARLAVIRKKKWPSKAVRAEVASAKRELKALVNAPVSGGRDPFEWLPDELIVKIMLVAPFEVLWSGVCERVCERWARLTESAPVERRKQEGKWAAYAAGEIKPRELVGHTSTLFALAVGLDGKIYSGARNQEIRVWSGVDGAHLQTLEGHAEAVFALAVGIDGKIYSGSNDKTIRVWSGDDGTHLQTLEGHMVGVRALAVGLDGKIYSGSFDSIIQVWSGVDGAHLQTLVGHTKDVYSLAVGLDGKVYSGSQDKTIRVWSGDDGTHLQTLLGHTREIATLAVGLDGKVFSGSEDKTIRVWSSDDGTHLQTLVGHARGVCGLAVDLDGKLFSGSFSEICVWSRGDGTLLHTLRSPENAWGWVWCIACGRDGSVFTSNNGDSKNVIMF
jgi:hypothetical protein